MKDPKEEAEDRAHEALAQKLGRAFRAHPDYKKIHYTVDAEDNPRLEVMNKVLKKAALRKVN